MKERERFRERIRGVNAIPVTPFRLDGEIDEAALGEAIRFLIDRGLDALYPCGNTGEFYSLDVEEAKRVASLSVEAAAGRGLIVVGVGHDAKTAAALAAHAERAGADGLMIHQPAHPFQREDGVLDYYRRIADATSLPIVLYVRSEGMSAATLREAAAIPNVVGVKYAVNHLPAFAQAVREVGSALEWICGTAETWAPFFYAAGAVGFTSGLANVDPGRSLAMAEALRLGRFEEAMRLWEETRPFERLRERRLSGDNVSVVKEAMAQLGRGNGVVRPPIAPLAAEEKREVSRILRTWGLLPEA
ncbi:dihydrodipicolinate synthase family protein [Paenibacillus antri]|uniref:Dihydrodipicolinate synthase family protein n=1 Tax=Paenibacillus antri TaxID=2582848 RepID=A0A5R9GG08_9BACL|nr:dihydrodipicolinate synthase family protein [Paenibacillus antri]TLS51643.1 dihydrodipicolinate synthase family protein [Paenibacillus antri]